MIILLHKIVQFALDACTILLTRWSLNMGSPDKDMRSFSWMVEDVQGIWKSLSFYRYPQFWHQIRGKRLVKEALA